MNTVRILEISRKLDYGNLGLLAGLYQVGGDAKGGAVSGLVRLFGHEDAGKCSQQHRPFATPEFGTTITDGRHAMEPERQSIRFRLDNPDVRIDLAAVGFI